MESDLRALKDDKDIARPDLLVMEPEANDGREPRSLLQRLELQR